MFLHILFFFVENLAQKLNFENMLIHESFPHFFQKHWKTCSYVSIFAKFWKNAHMRVFYWIFEIHVKKNQMCTYMSMLLNFIFMPPPPSSARVNCPKSFKRSKNQNWKFAQTWVKMTQSKIHWETYWPRKMHMCE